MLIRNEEEANQAKVITIMSLCSHCTDMLSYPYILTRNRSGENRYHPECAAQLASEMNESLNQLQQTPKSE